jgi:hypothetical protein
MAVFLGWRDRDDHISIARWENDRITNKITLIEKTTWGLSLATFNRRVFLCFSEQGTNRIKVMSSGNGLAFGNKIHLDYISSSPPLILAENARLSVIWSNDEPNDAPMKVVHSTDGVNFTAPFATGEFLIFPCATPVL